MNSYIQQGEKFLRECVFDGLAHSYDVETKQYVKPYPEVTGYVIKYLCDNSNGAEMNNIKDAAIYLTKIQHSIGGYKTFYDKRYLYSFDTAQILNGLISAYNHRITDEPLKPAILKAGEFLLYMQRSDGAIFPIYDTYLHMRRMPQKLYPIWNGPTSGLLCKLTEVFSEMYAFTDDERYLTAKEEATNYYIKVSPIEYTHPLGYWLEGLYAGGETVYVKTYLENNVIKRIENNGFIEYKSGLGYSYSSGEAQLAILLAKVGYVDEAVKIRDFLRNAQSKHESGGIFQFTNHEAEVDHHVHTEINSWGTKYYCELERMLEHYD